MTRTFRPSHCIMPPHVLQNLLKSDDQDIRDAALSTLLSNARLAGERTVRASFAAAAPASGRRTIFNCRKRTSLPSAVLARSEDGAESADKSVNQAFDGLGTTRQFYKEIHGRDSIDGQGMRLEGYVHRGRNYNNAFWDGQQMVFGDGDGKIFTDFTGSLDVIAHELAHGVTEHTAGLEYHTQPGALNEHISDVFGSLVKQWSHQQSAAEADWLIGSEIFTPGAEADALRSLKAPGKAYDNKAFGKDPQPDHMSKFVHLPDTDEGDNGGVHINSGIPNKAFYLAAVGIGGFACRQDSEQPQPEQRNGRGMKVTLATHGGLAAGINLRLPPRVVNADTLAPPLAAELAQLVAAAKAVETAEVPTEHTEAPPRRARDAMSYTITVEDGGHQVVLTESDTTMSPEFGALLSWLEQYS